MIIVFWLGAFIGLFYLGFPIIGTIGVFALALHSIAVMFRLKSNPEWYYMQCAMHSIEGDIKGAMVAKGIVALISIAVGVWLAVQAETKGLL